MNDTSAPRQEPRAAELEALLRLAAARVVVDAILAGHWPSDPELVRYVEILGAQARRFLEHPDWDAWRAA